MRVSEGMVIGWLAGNERERERERARERCGVVVVWCRSNPSPSPHHPITLSPITHVSLTVVSRYLPYIQLGSDWAKSVSPFGRGFVFLLKQKIPHRGFRIARGNNGFLIVGNDEMVKTATIIISKWTAQGTIR